MAKGTGGTIYLIGLIFAIIVAFVLLGIAYHMNTKWTEALDDARKQKEKADKERAESDRRGEEIKQLNKLINGQESGATYDGVAGQHMADISRTLGDMLSEEWIIAEERSTIKDPTVKAVWESLANFKEKFDKDQLERNFIAYQTECLKHLRAVLHVVPRLRIERIKSEEEKELIRKQIEDVRVAKEAVITELNDKLARESDKALETARKADAEKRRLTDEKDRLLKDQTRVEKENLVQLVKRDNEIQKLQRRIDELTKKARKSFYETARPDAEVSFADARQGYCWIDVGRAQGLRRGTRFQVFQYVKGGRAKVKAWAEVKQVEQDSAQCAILEAVEFIDPDTKEKRIIPDANDPVVKGDLLRCPFRQGGPNFDKDSQPRFYFLGQKPTNRYYTLGELEKKIDEFGGKVLKELTVEVDYVVVIGKGDEDLKNYEKAVQFGASFMREDELLDYIGK